jgi:CBS domain-containing protein
MARTQTANAAEPLLQELMIREPVNVTPETTLREAVELLEARHIGGMPVVSDGMVVGVVSVSDILTFLAYSPGVPVAPPDPMEWGEWGAAPDWIEEEEPPSSYFLELWSDAGADVAERIQGVAGPERDLLAEHTVSEVMTRQICALPPDTPVADAAAYMLQAGVHRVLVMEDGQLHGLVTTTDILRAVAERLL